MQRQRDDCAGAAETDCRRTQATWFRIASAKSEAEGRRLLGDYRGTVVADGYKVYKNLAQGRDRPGYRLAHCWAHVLRRVRLRAEGHSSVRGRLVCDGRVRPLPSEGTLA